MYNKKTLAVIGMTALMLVTMAGCGSKNNSAAEVNTTTATTAAAVKVENETKKSVTEATTEVATEAVTEAQTETQEAVSEEVTEAVTEAPAEVVETPAEAPVQAEVVNEAPVQEEVHTQSGVVIQQEESAQTSKPGIISNKTADKITLNADGTVSTPDGTYAGVTAYNEATGHTDHNDPEHLTQAGYLRGDTEAIRKAIEALDDRYESDPSFHIVTTKPAVNPYK